jgi:5-methylcytosine-specific restriction endonuclease McrA
MANEAHNKRRNRESLSKRYPRMARGIKARDNHRCIYCGATADECGSHLHLDHVLPKSKGGEDSADNLVCACAARTAMPRC